MSNLLAATSMLAVSSNLPPVNEEVPDYIEARILYNPFTPREVQIEKLEFREGLTLADYMEGLPEEASWMVFHNGVEVEPENFGNFKIVKGDRIALLMVPQGDVVKSILRIALVVASAVVGFMIGGLPGMFIGMAVGSMIGSLLLMPRAPKTNDKDDGTSYGIDGAKNSATEGIPYPVVYGEFRVGGNFADVYTENVGDTQYLYLRTVINDGEIEGIYDVELNEQPIANFQNVETDVRLGTANQAISTWFGRSIVQQNKSVKLGTSYTTHLTTGPVDMVRFDVMFPKGLVDIDQKKGTHRSQTVNFEMQYRPVDELTGAPTGGWTTLDQTDPRTYFGGALPSTFQLAKAMWINMSAPVGASSTFTPEVQYRPVGTSTWETAGSFSEDAQIHNYMVEPAGNIRGSNNYPLARRQLILDNIDPYTDYELRAINGAEIEAVTVYPHGGTGTGTVTDSRTRQIRASFTSGRVARGRYEVSIRRTSTESTSEYILDEVWLTDVAEIDCDPITLRHTAYLGLKIKLSEQLNQIPQVTARVKGCLLQEYDAAGNPTIKRWSANPAWIALDILLNEARGAGLSSSRIDFPAFVALAEYCDANAITFNGVFDTGSNLGDALRQVLRIGHAIPIPFGTRISVAIDKPRSPVQLFSSANITGDDFQVNYLSMNDRANEFEVSYFDKTDRNKQKNIKYVDPKAVTFNEVPRKIQMTLQGVDNAAQAKKELWRMVYANRLLVRTVSFTTSLESISMLLGDVALIQHPLIDWTYQGRVLGNTIASTTQVDIDQKITLEAGQTYSMLLRHDVLDLGTYTVSSKVANKLLIPTSAAVTADSVKRITSLDGSTDVSVYKVEKGGVYDTLHLDDATNFSGGQQVKLYNVDVIEERQVSSVTALGPNSTRVTLTAPLSKAAGPLAVYVLGKVTQVRRPYVLNGISGDGLDKRRLTFVEYNEGVYAAPELDLPTPVGRLSDKQVEQVRGLMFDYEVKAEANRTIVNCRAHWQVAHIINYGGADVYLKLNGAAERFIGSTTSNEYTVQLAPNDTVEFRVVAKNAYGLRAPITAAPAIKGTLNVSFAPLDPPQSLGYSLVNFEADGKVLFWWTPPTDTTGIEGYEFHYKKTTDTDWTAFGNQTISGLMVQVPGLEPGNYLARIRSISRTSTSTWLTSTTFSVSAPPGSLYYLRPAEPGANVTENNISSGFYGQSPWATYNGDSPTVYQQRVSYLDGSGYFADLDRITNRRITKLQRADGVTPVTEAAVVTSQGTAAAIAGQSSWATYNAYTPAQVTSPTVNLIYDAGLTLAGQQWELNGWTWAYGTGVGYYVYAPATSMNLRLGDRMTVGQSTAYTFSVHCGGDGYSGTPTLQLNFYDSGDNYIAQSTVSGPAAGTGYNRVSVTATSPANAVYARCYLSSPSSNPSYFIAYRPKLELGTTPTPWTNEATYGARYQTGVTIDSLKPAQPNADVTGTNTAAAISGQGPLATAPSASPYLNSGITIASNGSLSGAGGGQVTIGGLGYTGELNATWGARLGSNLRNSAATVTLGDGDVITNQGTAAAISGQTAWATYSGDSPTTYAGRVSGLDTSGNLSGLTKVTDRKLTLLNRADGVTPVTEAAVVTSLGTASAISGQGPLATAPSATPYLNSGITIASNGSLSGAGGGQVTIGGLGYTGELNATWGARLGSNLRNSAATVTLGDGDVITNQGTAAAISGQGPLATAPSASPYLNSGITIASNGSLSGAGGGAVTISGLSTTGAWGGQNMLLNSDFLLSSGGIPTGFGVYNNAGVSVTCSISSGGPLAGGNYWRITANATTYSTFGFLLTPNTASAGSAMRPYQPTTNYILSFYARAVSGTGGQTCEIRANNYPQIGSWLQNPPLNSSWQRYVFLFNFGNGAIDNTGFPFVDFGNGLAAGATIDFACLMIQQGDAVTGWAPAASTSNLTYGLGGATLASLKPAQANADVTASNTAAAIAGQGALATLNSVGSDRMAASYGSNLMPITNPAWVTPDTFFLAGWNPDGVTGITATRSAQSGGFGYEWSLDPMQSSWAIYQDNAGRGTNSVGVTDYYFKWLTDSSNSANYSQRIAIPGGQTMEFSVYMGNHRSDTCSVGLIYYDSAGNQINTGTNVSSNSIAANEAMGGNSLSGYKRVYFRSKAPSNAVSVLPYVRKGHTASGSSDSWLFMALPMLTPVPDNQTELTPWTPPGDVGVSVYSNGTTINALKPSEINANVTESRTAAAISGQGALATLNTVTADKINVTSLSAISAVIGTLRTATTGARTEISDNVIKVYDSSNVLRVKIGNLSL